MCSIKVVVHNQQAQPIEGCLYLYNHCSNIDPLVVQSAVAKPVRMGAKKELFKVPVLGRGMLLGGTLPIDRTNREAVLNSYRNIYKDVQAGDNFALAPEGTRQPQEFPFGNFKLGPFTFAIEAQVPIVPLVIVGSSKVWGKKQLLPATNSFKNKIDVIVCKPLKPDEFKGLDNIALSEKVKLLMSTAYTEFVKGS